MADYLTANFAAGETLRWTAAACLPPWRKSRRPGQERRCPQESGRSQLHLGCYRRAQALPDTACELLTPAQTGATAADRIALVRAELEKAGATALAVTGLTAGWLLNLAPATCPAPLLAVAMPLVTREACTLFLADGRLNAEDAATLAASGVTARYNELLTAASPCLPTRCSWWTRKATNYDLYTAPDRPQDRSRCRPDFCAEGHQESHRAGEHPRVPCP